MEPAPKKPKFEISKKKLEFLDMNDDCITLVLEKLHKTDLCSTSFLSERLQELSYAVHMRKFPKKSITIRAVSDDKSGHIKVGFGKFYGNETYLKYMTKAVRNVEIICSRKGIREYFKVLKSECTPNLKSLKIVRARSNLSSIPAAMIKDQLKNLEELSIETLPNRAIKGIHKNWLTYCQNLRELSITTQFCKGEWMLGVYPQLESLSICLLKMERENGYFAQNAGQFFQRHPKLKEIKCSGFKTTQLLLQNVNNIHRLIVGAEIGDFGHTESVRLADELKIHREKGRIDWLEFDLEHGFDEHFRLSEVDAVHPVKGLRTRLFNPNGQSKVEVLKHLELLELIVAQAENVDWIRLSKNLPNVETIKLSWNFVYEGSSELLDTIKPFVQNMPHLKRLDVSVDRFAEVASNHLMELNSARLLGKNPVHLHVNFNLGDNKSKLIMPISNILTTRVFRIADEHDSSDAYDSSDDASSNDSYSDDDINGSFDYFTSDNDLSSDDDDDDDDDDSDSSSSSRNVLFP